MKNMKIYCAHSSAFDYQHNWYDVLRASPLAVEHELIFPHEHEVVQKNSYPMLQTVDCIIAEVSYPSLGLNTELGWAQSLQKPLYCLHTSDTQVPTSVADIATDCAAYNSKEELIYLISQFLSHEMNHTQ
jgi:nucleoside 2-deoxyribosyltransferase